MNQNSRKWLGILASILVYYFVHEGSHLLVAYLLGVFESIRFLALGVQIVIDPTGLSDWQFAMFNIAGSISTLLCAYTLVLLKSHILHLKSHVIKAICYYTTVGLLLIDPIYLSVLCGFFGGGDMNGIVLFGLPELAVRIVYGFIGLLNFIVMIKYVTPPYKENFLKK